MSHAEFTLECAQTLLRANDIYEFSKIETNNLATSAISL